MSRTQFITPTTLAKYDVPVCAQRPRHVSPKLKTPSLEASSPNPSWVESTPVPPSQPGPSLLDRFPPWVAMNIRSKQSRKMLLRCWLGSLVAFVIMRGPHLGGHQHPTEHAVDPENAAGECEEHLRQDIVDKALAQGVRITRTQWLRGQEFVEGLPSIWLAVTAALSCKECDHPNQKAKQSRWWQQREDDQDCGSDAKMIKNHGGNDDEGNQDDHGGGDNDAKTIMVASMTVKTIKMAMVTRRRSRTMAVTQGLLYLGQSLLGVGVGVTLNYHILTSMAWVLLLKTKITSLLHLVGMQVAYTVLMFLDRPHC
ncbi:hypothetical protein EDB86DRAFT_3081090 [Lactarius hatsudake]|nr:hypothetical protein EDB86DRAFT_3081090 [Lactarius hatsudake]